MKTVSLESAIPPFIEQSTLVYLIHPSKGVLKGIEEQSGSCAIEEKPDGEKEKLKPEERLL